MQQLMGSIRRQVGRALRSLGLDLSPRVGPDIDRKLQLLLMSEYRRCVSEGRQLPSFSDVEFASFSQNGEDGILLLLFAVLGATNKTVVEACAGDGIECNAANLIVNHGWSGLLFDGNAAALERGRRFYAKRSGGWRLRRLPPRLVSAWITADNINELIKENGVAGEIDLLSLDLDGVDYWIWKAMTAVSPRVVVLEYNNRWAANQSVTVPYRSDFLGTGVSVAGVGYFGASLMACTKLARLKGYRLVGANSPNTNAFFLRNDVGPEHFPEVTVESCLSAEYAIHQHREKYPLIADLPVEIV